MSQHVHLQNLGILMAVTGKNGALGAFSWEVLDLASAMSSDAMLGDIFMSIALMMWPAVGNFKLQVCTLLALQNATLQAEHMDKGCMDSELTYCKRWSSRRTESWQAYTG